MGGVGLSHRMTLANHIGSILVLGFCHHGEPGSMVAHARHHLILALSPPHRWWSLKPALGPAGSRRPSGPSWGAGLCRPGPSGAPAVPARARRAPMAPRSTPDRLRGLVRPGCPAPPGPPPVRGAAACWPWPWRPPPDSARWTADRLMPAVRPGLASRRRRGMNGPPSA